jgi:hypothetical protein
LDGWVWVGDVFFEGEVGGYGFEEAVAVEEFG